MKPILYTQDGCPQCRMIHILLDKNHIEYEECQDVELMKSKGISHTPTLEIDNQLLKGKELIDWINVRR